MRVPSRCHRWLCLSLIAISAQIVASQGLALAEEPTEKYTLRYKFLAAKRVACTVENQSEIHVQHGQVEEHIQHREETSKHYIVISTDLDGNGILELSIDRVQMSASIDGNDPVTFDSDSGDEPPDEFEGVADKIGQPHVRVKVSPTGEVLSLQWLGVDEQPVPSAQNAGNLDILVRLPEEPVAIGDIWKERFETEVSVGPALKKTVTLQRTYRLAAVDGNRATIELETSVITPMRDPAQEAQLIQKTPSGTIEFDINRGIVLSRSTNVSRKVVGFNGAKSFLQNTTSRIERYVESGTIRQARDSGGVQR